MNQKRNTFGRKTITRKSKNLHPKVDLTAMVSISFLLIIFFMLSSFLSRPNKIEFSMPGEDRGCCFGGCGSDVWKNRLCTLLLSNDKIVLYRGNYQIQKTLSYKKNELAKTLKLLDEKIRIQSNDLKKGLILMVKPSKKSNYGKLVHVLDEMTIAQTITYSVTDITAVEEVILLKK